MLCVCVCVYIFCACVHFWMDCRIIFVVASVGCLTFCCGGGGGAFISLCVRTYPEFLSLRTSLDAFVGRLKVNMGNIYFRQKNYPKAVKFYRMALDQVPNTHKEMRYLDFHLVGMGLADWFITKKNPAYFHYACVYVCICDAQHSSVIVHWERLQESWKFWTECGVTVVFIYTR